MTRTLAKFAIPFPYFFTEGPAVFRDTRQHSTVVFKGNTVDMALQIGDPSLHILPELVRGKHLAGNAYEVIPLYGHAHRPCQMAGIY